MNRRPFGQAIALAAVAVVASSCQPPAVTLPLPTVPSALVWHPGWGAALAFPGTMRTAMHCRYVTRVAAGGSGLSLELADPFPASSTSSFHVRAAAVEQGSTLLVPAPVAPVPRPSASPTSTAVPSSTAVPTSSTTPSPSPVPVAPTSSPTTDPVPTAAPTTAAPTTDPTTTPTVDPSLTPSVVPVAQLASVVPLRRPVTFAGAAGVRVAALGQVVSDPVPMPVTAGQQLVVDLQVDAGDAPATVAGWEHNRCVPLAGGTVTTDSSVHWLSGIRVLGPKVRSVAALGDSITEGAGLAPGSYARWADRLVAGGSDVVNKGVSGGAISRTGLFGSIDGVTRDRALAAEPGLSDVVVALGTNDLTLGQGPAPILTAIDRVIALDRARGVRTWVATILPRGSRTVAFPQEAGRQYVNGALRGTWLTSRGAAVVDLDAALRDPSYPRQMLPAYDSGDHLHPNAAGYLQIARRVASTMHLPAPR